MRIILSILVMILFQACTQDEIPKPRGYFRIDLPKKNYVKYLNDCPFSFEIPEYASIKNDRSNSNEKCWLNIDYSKFKSRLHLSYKEIKKLEDFYQYTEDTRSLAFKHVVKASEIDEIIISFPQKKVSGIVYEIEGNTASSMQFYLSDSTNHFIRGSLYFNTTPNIDSLSPVLNFIKKDVQHMINTLQWQ